MIDDQKLEFLKEDIKNLIKLKRQSKQLSQKDLSNVIGISKGFLSLYERGQTEMTVPNLLKIIYALDMVEDFFILLKNAFEK